MAADNPHPALLLIELNKSSFQDEMSSHMLSALKSLATVIHSTSPTDASTKITSLIPSTILITTADFAKRKHAPLCRKVVEYARAGGTVIICGQFCNMISPPDFNSFFQLHWDLQWKFGAYNRSTFVPNPRRHTKLRNARIPESYSIKAVHIKDAAVEEMVYITNEDSRIESMVFAAESAHRPDQAPIVFTSFGKGFLGYVGDVNQEEKTTDVILAMCNWGKLPDVSALLTDKSRCRICLKKPAQICAKCKNASYCSKECQKIDWNEHKQVCGTTPREN